MCISLFHHVSRLLLLLLPLLLRLAKHKLALRRCGRAKAEHPAGRLWRRKRRHRGLPPSAECRPAAKGPATTALLLLLPQSLLPARLRPHRHCEPGGRGAKQRQLCRLQPGRVLRVDGDLRAPISHPGVAFTQSPGAMPHEVVDHNCR